MTKVIFLSLFALITFVPSVAYSAPISAWCPPAPGPDDERQFGVGVDEGSATCLAYGDGANDMNGAAGQDVIIDDASTDWQLIDKDHSSDADAPFTVQFGTGGSWSIDASLWGDYDRLAIGFKVGGGGDTPTWAVFELLGGADSGSWIVQMLGGDTSVQALSHANLYGILDDGRDIQSVPEPASLVLLGAGLSVLARRRMRRNQNKA